MAWFRGDGGDQLVEADSIEDAAEEMANIGAASEGGYVAIQRGDGVTERDTHRYRLTIVVGSRCVEYLLDIRKVAA